MLEVYFQLNLPPIPDLTISTGDQGDDAAREETRCDSYPRVGRDPIARKRLAMRTRIPGVASPDPLHDLEPAPSTKYPAITTIGDQPTRRVGCSAPKN